MLNPDEEVQARIRLVFEKFRDIRSASGVMRSLRAAHLPLPARPRVGPAPRRGWSGNQHAPQPSSIFSTIQPMLGPMSMGVSSLTLHVALKPHPRGGRILQPIDKWDICLHNTYPAYIAWEEFVANQAQLHANSLNESCGATWDGTERPSETPKGSCAVGAVEPYSTCTILVGRANGPSIGVVPTRASLEAQTANACVRWLWIGRSKSGSWKRCGQIK
jgi:hypothetical protein